MGKFRMNKAVSGIKKNLNTVETIFVEAKENLFLIKIEMFLSNCLEKKAYNPRSLEVL